ncbi:hypothetical protein AMTR_s00029p00232250 [Amborella trichopoda]|uniref:Uncharacterized protein n=1 Tax=Amborella trichopoda TaxID=13333 RepID=W1PR87_AMBTC|nr:hypothetical protein AMTR_s00029p00232250 [Amborella trichopoda]
MVYVYLYSNFKCLNFKGSLLFLSHKEGGEGSRGAERRLEPPVCTINNEGMRGAERRLEPPVCTINNEGMRGAGRGGAARLELTGYRAPPVKGKRESGLWHLGWAGGPRTTRLIRRQVGG